MIFEELSLGMMLTETGLLDAVIAEILVMPQLMSFIAKNRGAKKAIQGQLNRWKDDVREDLMQIEIEDDLKQEISLYRTAQGWLPQHFSMHVPHLISSLENRSGFYIKARLLAEFDGKKPAEMLYRQFMQAWQKYLVDNLTELQQQAIAAHKERLLADIYRRIENSENFMQLSDAEDAEVGTPLWDMSSATLKKQDIRLLRSTANRLRKHPKLLEIVENIGRSAQTKLDTETLFERVEVDEVERVSSEYIPDDIIGVYPSDDISRMLANEAVYLSEPELEILFYKRLVEKQLMNYQYQGSEERVVHSSALQASSSQSVEPGGSFIICLDASGSMQGDPEKLAKALTLALMQFALEQHRECKLMIFSKDFIDYDLSGESGLTDLVDFIGYSFHGGTDLEPVLSRSVDLMCSNEYKNADLVVISDFIAPSQPYALLKKIASLKSAENRLHAVTLSQHANPSVMRIFDQVWSFSLSRFSFF